MLILVNLTKFWCTHNVKRRCITHTVNTKGKTCYVYMF